MIKTRLIGLVPESKKYIVGNVLAQWLGLCAGAVIFIAVLLRVLCVKLASSASYHASRSVKRTLRGKIYEKLQRLGTAYTEHVPTGEVVQLAGEGVEQLETYFGASLLATRSFLPFGKKNL